MSCTREYTCDGCRRKYEPEWPSTAEQVRFVNAYFDLCAACVQRLAAAVHDETAPPPRPVAPVPDARDARIAQLESAAGQRDARITELESALSRERVAVANAVAEHQRWREHADGFVEGILHLVRWIDGVPHSINLDDEMTEIVSFVHDFPGRSLRLREVTRRGLDLANDIANGAEYVPYYDRAEHDPDREP